MVGPAKPLGSCCVAVEVGRAGNAPGLRTAIISMIHQCRLEDGVSRKVSEAVVEKRHETKLSFKLIFRR